MKYEVDMEKIDLSVSKIPVRMYLKEIEEVPLLSAEEETGETDAEGD